LGFLRIISKLLKRGIRFHWELKVRSNFPRPVNPDYSIPNPSSFQGPFSFGYTVIIILFGKSGKSTGEEEKRSWIHAGMQTNGVAAAAE